jgi:ATP-binding cassette, subfamily B (MDR/TAP), member 1
VAGERQATRLRSLYLKAVLRQDIAFFDVEMTTADAASRMSADTVLIQDALGEKVTLFFSKNRLYLCGLLLIKLSLVRLLTQIHSL